MRVEKSSFESKPQTRSKIMPKTGGVWGAVKIFSDTNVICETWKKLLTGNELSIFVIYNSEGFDNRQLSYLKWDFVKCKKFSIRAYFGHLLESTKHGARCMQKSSSCSHYCKNILFPSFFNELKISNHSQIQRNPVLRSSE